MIKILVPSISGGQERKEGSTQWVAAKPHVLSQYPIYPIEGPINLDYGVYLDRGRSHWTHGVDHENRIYVNTHGNTQVLVGNRLLDTSRRPGFHIGEVSPGVTGYYSAGRTYLSMEEGSEAVLTVVGNGEKVSEAKLVVVSGEEARQVVLAEAKVESRWLGELGGGTSDFLY